MQVVTDAKKSKEQIDEVLLVGGPTRIPRVRQVLKDFFHGRDIFRVFNPQESVVMGASNQGAILSPQIMHRWEKLINSCLLLTATPLDLCCKVGQGAMTTMMKKNTCIPAKRTKVISFDLNHDEQGCVQVFVYEVSGSLANDCSLLSDSLQLDGIPPVVNG